MTQKVEFFTNALVKAFNKEIDINEAGKIYCMLLNAAPDKDLDDYVDDIRADEIEGTNYTAGGEVMTNCTITRTATSTVTLDADDTNWAGLIATFTHAAVYYSTGVDATSSLICLVDFGGEQVIVGDWGIQWNEDTGIGQGHIY